MLEPQTAVADRLERIDLKPFDPRAPNTREWQRQRYVEDWRRRMADAKRTVRGEQW